MAIQTELQKATKIKKMEGEANQSFLIRLSKAVNKLPDEDAGDATPWWGALSDDAQKWANLANTARENKEPLPEFDGSVKADEEEGPSVEEPVEEEEDTVRTETEEAPVTRTRRVLKVAKTRTKEAKANGGKKGKTKVVVKAKKVRGNGKNKKTEIVGSLLQRASGCTSKDILSATGWPSVSVPAMAKACGLKLRKERKSGERTRYFGS